MKFFGARKTSIAFTKARDEFPLGVKEIENFPFWIFRKNSCTSGNFKLLPVVVKFWSRGNSEAETSKRDVESFVELKKWRRTR